MRKIVSIAALIWVMTSSAQAQYTASYQTNIIDNVVSNWPGNYLVGTNLLHDDVLLIQNAGVLAASAAGHLGFTGDSSNNTVLVTGAGSVWSMSDWIFVGHSGTGNQLTIANSGTVYNAKAAYIGYNDGANNNAVTVTGAGSVWSNSHFVSAGAFGTGNTLTISNRGTVYSTEGYVGANNNNNSALVTGVGSAWKNSGDFFMGYYGAGNQLTIADGGALYNSNGRIGVTASGVNNTVLVTGAGSIWSNSNDLIIGNSGAGNQLTISNSGTVFASHVFVGKEANSTGNQLVISGGNLCATNAAGTGTLEVRRGTLVFNGGTIQTDQLLADNGASSVVNFNAGTLTTKGALVNNGVAFTVGDGVQSATYAALGGEHIFSSGLTIASQGALVGSGYVNNATIADGGNLAPGFSPGTLTFKDLTLNDGALVTAEIASPALFDRVIATNLTVDGAVTWNLSLSDTAPVLPDTVFTMFAIGDYLGGETSGWLTLGGMNQLLEGEVFTVPNGVDSLEQFRVSYVGNDGNDVILTAIPEPTNVLMLMVAGVAVYARRRIRQKTGRWHR